MQVTVIKNPDGVLFMTKDGHGEVFSKDVAVGKPAATFGDCWVEFGVDEHPFAADGALLVRFSWVDYLDTSNREVPGDGVRHTVERSAPGRFDAGPYVVEVS